MVTDRDSTGMWKLPLMQLTFFPCSSTLLVIGCCEEYLCRSDWFRQSADELKIFLWYFGWLQGLFYWWSESFCLLLLKYGFQWLLKSTGGSPDVVHLIIYASQVFGWLLKITTAPEAKNMLIWECTKLGSFFLFLMGVGIFKPSYLSHFLTKQRCFCACWKANFLNFLKLTLFFISPHL